MHSWVCVLFLVCGILSPAPRSRGSQADAGGEKLRGTFEGVTFLRLSPPRAGAKGGPVASSARACARRRRFFLEKGAFHGCDPRGLVVSGESGVKGVFSACGKKQPGRASAEPFTNPRRSQARAVREPAVGTELCAAAGGEPGLLAFCSPIPCQCLPWALAAVTWVSPLEHRAGWEAGLAQCRAHAWHRGLECGPELPACTPSLPRLW